MEGCVGQFDAAGGAGRLERGDIVHQVAGKSVHHTRGGLRGMQRSPSAARHANLSEWRYRCEGRRTCRHHAIDLEVRPPVIEGDAKRTANENGILAARIDEEFALERYGPIDDHRKDRSIVAPLDPGVLRLVHRMPSETAIDFK